MSFNRLGAAVWIVPRGGGAERLRQSAIVAVTGLDSNTQLTGDPDTANTALDYEAAAIRRGTTENHHGTGCANPGARRHVPTKRGPRTGARLGYAGGTFAGATGRHRSLAATGATAGESHAAWGRCPRHAG